MAIYCMFLALSGKLTRLVGPIYMLGKPRVKMSAGDRIGKLHPVWKENARLCLDWQAIIVTVLCFFDFYFAKRCGGLHWIVNGANDHHLFYSLSGDITAFCETFT